MWPLARVERHEDQRIIPWPTFSASTNVGITVADLGLVTVFFVGLGFEVEGTRTFIEGDFLDTVIGISNSRTEIILLRDLEPGLVAVAAVVSELLPPPTVLIHPKGSSVRLRIRCDTT